MFPLKSFAFACIIFVAAAPFATAQHHHHRPPQHHHHDSDPALARVQAALARLDMYHGPIDGVWGPESRKAIRLYQHRHGLAETGSISHQLLEHLGLAH